MCQRFISAKKGLIPHVKPEKSAIFLVAHPIPPTCHLRPVSHTPSTNQGLPTNAVLPIPKPRVGQGRVGVRRKAKVTLPIPKPSQIPTPPIPKPDPRTAQPLPESITQSQDSIIPQHHVPMMPQPLVEPTPPSITQPIGPITHNRPIPPYHEPFERPPLRPPDATAMKDNRTDLTDFDMDRKIEFEDNLPHQ